MNIDYGFGMYNKFEGENFIPPGLKSTSNSGSPPYNSSPASFDHWLRGFLPEFSEHRVGSSKPERSAGSNCSSCKAGETGSLGQAEARLSKAAGAHMHCCSYRSEIMNR